MRSILEKALIALLNEEKDKADALFHDFILERSRQIHESLRQGEDFVLDESWEQELSIDEMFSEADLADEEPVADEEGEEAEADAIDTTDAEGEDAAADEITADAEEGKGEEVADDRPIEDRVEDLEAELQRLAAEFDAQFSDDDGLGDLVGDMDVTADDTPELPMAGDETAGDATDDADEQFEALGESAVDELQEVSVTHAEGKTTSGSQKVDTKARALVTPPEKRQAGEPVKVKSAQHSGYEREAAPKSGSLPKGKNTLTKADASQSGVKKEGDKAAILNKGGEDKSAQHSLFDKKRV